MTDKTGNDTALSVQSVREAGHQSTTNERISKDAAIRVAFEEENRIQEVFRLAEVVASRAGRKTVQEEDVITVYQIMESEIT